MNIEFKLVLLLSEAISASYNDLKRVDGHPESAGWSVEEVLAAIKPTLAKIAAYYHEKAPEYEPDDYVQEGLMRIWKLYKEEFNRDFSWASYAVGAAKNAMSQLISGGGEAGGRLVPTTYRDPNAVTVSHLGGAYDVPSDNPSTTKVQCPDCGGGSTRGECETCKGKGKVVRPRERSSSDPTQEAETKDWIEHNRRILQGLIKDGELSAYQTEALLLRYGAEGAYNDAVNSSDEPKFPAEISRIIGYGRAIQELYGHVIGSGIEGRMAFEEAWDQVFGQYGYKFIADIPISLQIATIPKEDRDTVVERLRAALAGTIRIAGNVGQPERHTISKAAVQNRLARAVSRLHQAAGA